MKSSTRALALAALIASAPGCGNLFTGPSDIDLDGMPGEATISEGGWSRPVRLAVSDEGFEDSPYITRDGKFVMFFYHPARDILTDPEAALRVQLDGRIFISPRPFEAKTIYPVSTPDPVSEAGPYFGTGGAFFYYRTFPFSSQPTRIVRNGTILDLGTGGAELDPCYCDAMDELYFASDGESNGGGRSDHRSVFVHKNGQTTKLPSPINLSNFESTHPFLTDDCQTMYFTSTRSSAPFPRVYRSRRQGEFQWSTPELFISRSTGGVGEMTMTKDGREITFIELRLEGAGATTDVFYSRR